MQDSQRNESEASRLGQWVLSVLLGKISPPTDNLGKQDFIFRGKNEFSFIIGTAKNDPPVSLSLMLLI